MSKHHTEESGPVAAPREASAGPLEIDLAETEAPAAAPREVPTAAPTRTDRAAKTDESPAEPAPCDEYPVAARVEALLMSTDRPLTEARIGELLDLARGGREKAVRAAIDELNAAYQADGRAFGIERLAGGWQVLTRPEFGPLLARLHRDRQQSRLTPAAMETLAIVGYRQPIIRAEIEAIRGVACGEVLRGLLERRLVKIVGRAEELGRPMLYGTTREFLKVFGLSSLDDLPEVEGLKPGRTGGLASAAPSAAEDSGDAAPESDAADAAPQSDPGDAAPEEALEPPVASGPE